MTKLTPHFSLDELIVSETAARHGIDNRPTGRNLAHLTRLAETMEEVRRILGDKPVIVTSGYRSRAVNSAVGGSALSAHMHGLAVDFIVPGFGTPLEICRALQPHMDTLEIDQLIHEFGAWVHLGLVAEEGGHRLMALTIDQHGTRSGFG